jgi:hypothetical protein
MKKLYFIISVSLLSIIAPACIDAQVQSSSLTKQWNGSSWENQVKDTNFIYNSNCQLLYNLGETWDSSANNWDNSLQFNLSYYNSNGKFYQDSEQVWNSVTSIWNNYTLVTDTYDGSNYLINQSLKPWDTTTNSWQNYYQTAYINNIDGTPHMAYDLLWSGGAWDTIGIKNFRYNISGQLDSELFVSPIGNIVGTIYSYTYGTSYVRWLDQTWNTNTNSWRNEQLVTYWPNMNMPDSITLELTANVPDTTFSRQTFTYTPCTPAAIAQIDPADPLHVYPDPSIGYFTVSGLMQGQSVEIYDCEGQRLASRIADHTTMDFNIASYASGMYLVRASNQDGSMAIQKKIVKTQ